VQNAALTHVATYERSVGASEQRVWENVRDWEHLPYLHASSFRTIALEDAGAWGWRARIGLHPSNEIVLELRIETDAPRYVSRTLAGVGTGSEIWTTVTPETQHRTAIEVEFWLPGILPEQTAAVGAAYETLYTRLWDEDEAMMVRRERELARGHEPDGAPDRVALGSERALRARLPHCVSWRGRRFRIVDLDGELLVHATTCPHQLGPLEDAPIEAGAITCPWHGWRFDVRSGDALDGNRGRLPTAPRIEADRDGNLWLSEPNVE
jgi:nitrite reductase/ring-hydroxylating ferredoxin subunit